MGKIGVAVEADTRRCYYRINIQNANEMRCVLTHVNCSWTYVAYARPDHHIYIYTELERMLQPEQRTHWPVGTYSTDPSLVY
jgi:hypothetical protein